MYSCDIPSLPNAPKMGKSRLHSDCLLPWGEEQKWKDLSVKSSSASDSLQRSRVCSAAELPLAVYTGVLASPWCLLLRSDDRIQNIALSVFDYRCEVSGGWFSFVTFIHILYLHSSSASMFLLHPFSLFGSVPVLESQKSCLYCCDACFYLHCCLKINK